MSCAVCQKEEAHEHYACPVCKDDCPICGAPSDTPNVCHCGAELESMCQVCGNVQSKCICNK